MLQSWDLIRTFLALHRTCGFEGAARSLRLDQTTVRRKLQSLEIEIGAPVFARINGQLIVEPQFEGLLRAAVQMEAAFENFNQQSDLSLHRGAICVTTLDIFASLLAPDIACFRRGNPDIQLEIRTEPHFVDLEKERVDLAVRLARPVKGTLGLKKLGEVSFRVYGSPEYLDRTDPSEGQDLLSFYAHFGDLNNELLLPDERWLQGEQIQGQVVARADSYPTLLRLCEQGMGLAILPCVLADGSTRVRTYAGRESSFEVDVWAVIRQDVARLPKVRSFVECLSDAFRRHRPLLRGTAHSPDPVRDLLAG